MQITAARLGFILVFEHFVFFVTDVVDWLIPDIPQHVQTAIEREKYLGKEALNAKEADSEQLDKSKNAGLSALPEENSAILSDMDDMKTGTRPNSVTSINPDKSKLGHSQLSVDTVSPEVTSGVIDRQHSSHIPSEYISEKNV